MRRLGLYPQGVLDKASFSLFLIYFELFIFDDLFIYFEIACLLFLSPQ